MADGFEERTAKYVCWLRQQGVAISSEKLQVVDGRKQGQGRCMVAVEGFAEGDVLFEVPQSALLNVESSGSAAMHKIAKELGQWQALVAILLQEMYVLQEQSKWWPYFRVLPDKESLDSLMYWRDDEIEYLRPSLIVDRIGKDEARNMFESIQKYVETHQELELAQHPEVITWDNFLHVATLIMSYSFDIERNSEEDDAEEDSIKSMVPLADTLNADTHLCNAHLVYDANSLIMRATQPIQKGEQIYNTYGEHSNAELLRRYGYVEWGGSQYDFAEVALQNIVKSIRQKFSTVETSFLDTVFELLNEDDDIQEILDNESIVQPSFDCFADGRVSPELLVLIQILVSLLQISNIFDYPKDKIASILQRVAKKCLQLVERNMLSHSCPDMLTACINDRIAEYKDVNAECTNIRKKMANTVLDGERKCLQQCLCTVKSAFKIIDDTKLLQTITKNKVDQSGRQVKRRKI